jgi:hypothetical protein
MTKKITQLPAATTPLAGTELLEIVQGGVSSQVAVSDLGGGNGNGKANRIAASSYAGADIGAKINAAVAYLLTIGGGIVEVEDSATPYAWSTTVTLEEGTSLSLGAGDYVCTMAGNTVLYKSRTSLIGAGNATRIFESTNAAAEAIRMFRDYASTAALDTDVDSNSDIYIANLQIVGASPNFDSARSTISMHNVHRVRVENVFLNGTRANGICFGGTSNTGNHATDVEIVGCRFENVACQAIGIVNAQRFNLHRNMFKGAAQAAGPLGSFIDCEVNAPADILEGGTIVGNVIDARGSAYAGNGILLQGGGSPRARSIDIVGNTLIGGDFNPDAVSSDMTIGIYLTNIDDALVSGNTILRCAGEAAYLLECNRVTVSGNRFTSTGGTGNRAVALESCTYCRILGNAFFSPGGADIATDSVTIAEAGAADYNIVTGNSLTLLTGNTADPATYDPKIVLVGANSRAFNNDLKGYSAGRGYPTSIADLRLFPMPPGTGLAPVASDGHATAGDGGGALWRWDSASSTADDGVTVVKPTNLSGNGRWKRAGQYLKLTTVQRNALSLGAGDASFTIYNTTSNVLQTWNGGSWNDLWTAAVAPTITALNYAQGNTAGGGADIVITGTDFTGATSVTFLGTNATGFTVDSATQITATLPAHAAGTGDVVVTGPGGSSAGFAFEYWDPTQLTNFARKWSASFAGPPWTDTGGDTLASIGGSADPAVGGAVNGYTPADFDGVDDQLAGTSTANLVGSGNYGVFALAKPNTADATAANLYDNNAIWQHYSGNGGICVRDNGGTPQAVSWHHDGIGFIPAPVTMALGAWQLIAGTYDGTNIRTDVNATAGTPVAVAAGYSSHNVFRVGGSSFSASAYLDGEILEFVSMKAAPTNGERTKMLKYCRQKFGLTL